MTDLLHQASDDQIALALCFGAVLVSGLVMHFSHHVGRMTGRVRLHETAGERGFALQDAQPRHSHLAAEAATRDKAA